MDSGSRRPTADKLCGAFSGGWQMRIALAKILVRRPENVLLDEPTNHLDNAAREFLADELTKYTGAVLVVTHDAEFLDRVAGRIFELRDGVAEAYTGNYSEFQRQKTERHAAAGPCCRPAGARAGQAGALHRAVPCEALEGEGGEEPREGDREDRAH